MFAKYIKEIEAEIPALIGRERANISRLAYNFLHAFQYLSELEEHQLFSAHTSVGFIQDYFIQQVASINNLSEDIRKGRQSVLERAGAVMTTLIELLDKHLITKDTQLAGFYKSLKINLPSMLRSRVSWKNKQFIESI